MIGVAQPIRASANTEGWRLGRHGRIPGSLCPAFGRGFVANGSDQSSELRRMPDSNPGASQQNTGSWNAAIFVGLVVVVAALFTLYVLLWDGGAHT